MNPIVKKLLSLGCAVTLAFGATANTAALTYVPAANDVSDAYKGSVFYKNLSELKLTGDGATDVLAVALTQLGYQEGDSLGAYSGEISGSDNYTEYNHNMGNFGQGYGGKNYAWCASFVSFCLLQAGCTDQTKISDWVRKHYGDPAYLWREVGVPSWAKQMRLCGYFEDSVHFGGSYVPQSGNLIFFTQNGTSESHIGLVLYSDGTKVYTVEGNTSSASGLESNGGGVYYKSYKLTSSYIRGYGLLPYKTTDDPKPDYSGANPTTGTYVATTNKYVFRNQSDTKYTWLLPRYSVFTVTEVVSPDLVKGECTINGERVTGYIMNNTDRIIQLYRDDTEEPKRIKISKNPTKLTYEVGEAFDPSGMEITAIYASGKRETVTDYTVSADTSAVGLRSVTVTYKNQSVMLSINVTEPKPYAVFVSSKPSKLAYLEGESLDLSGMTVRAYYNSGKSETVTGYTVSGYDPAPGEKTVTVSYGELSDTFTVTVNPKSAVRLILESLPDKLTYNEGEDFDPAGLSLRVYYNNGTDSISSDYTISGYDPTPGEKTVTVTCEGVSTDFTVNVLPSYIRGDVNEDGKINTADAAAIIRHLASWSISPFNEKAADVDENGRITVSDAAYILRHVAGWEEYKLP